MSARRRGTSRIMLLAAALMLLILGDPGVGWGQDGKEAEQEAPTPPDPAVAPPKSEGGGKIIVLEEELIEGRIQKPEAFYILQRSNLNYQSLELQKSFVPNIVDSVKKQPF